MMKFIAIDIEGDGINKKRRLQVFPEGTHFDEETRICCFAIAARESARELVCKLPEKPRVLPRPWQDSYGRDVWTTRIYHEAATTIPNTVKGYPVTAFKDYEEYLRHIEAFLLHCCKEGIKVFYKGYRLEQDYDYELLNANGISQEALSCLVNAYSLLPSLDSYWQTTYCQGKICSNQEFLNNTLTHCLEDTQQLYRILKENLK